MGRPHSASLESEWRERVATWRRSGLSAREFAQREAIGVSSLFNWAKRFDASDDPPRLIQLIPKSAAPSHRLCADGMTVRVGEAVIEVRHGFDPDLLADVVRALRKAAP